MKMAVQSGASSLLAKPVPESAVVRANMYGMRVYNVCRHGNASANLVWSWVQ